MNIRAACRHALGIVALACASAGAAHAQDPTHAYTLNGTYADALGGPSLVSLGGTLGPTGYTFAANQGLSLANAINATNYSIEMTFSFAGNANLTSWRKILDFSNRQSDAGVYGYNQNLQFYPEITAQVTAIQAGTPLHLLVTRDAGTSQFVAFINGQQQFSFVDAASRATFSGPNNIIHFLTDDVIVTGESAPGSIDWIRLYDRPLNAAEAAARYQLGDNPLTPPPVGVVPEPGTVALLAAGLLAVGGAAARRKRAAA